MNILELDSYNLADAVKFNDQLNPRIWDGTKMRPEVREKLLAIAADFQESLGVDNLDVEDITVSGSNAGFTYTPHSDIDLHLVVRMPEQCDEVYQELFNAKKYQYNDEHDIRIGGYDVELYVQPADQPHVSAGVYSVKNNDWIHIPRKIAARVDDESVRNKYQDVKARIDSALKSNNIDLMRKLWDKIKDMRKSGLAQNGELGPENLAFKMLRTQGDLGKLKDAIRRARDAELSLTERRKKKKKSRVKYGFGGYWYPGFAFGSGEGSEGGSDGGGGESRVGEDVSNTPDGVSPSTKMFLSEKDIPSHTEIIFDFMRFVVHELELHNVPKLKIRKDPQWSVINKSFGRYRDDLGQIDLAVGNRHIMDVLRTLAHELQHRKQDEREHMPPDAGQTGSPYENEAHAVAGVLMRKYADLHPEYFEDVPVSESASGYIPTKAQAKDPRYTMALTVDIKPGQVGKEANKMALKTDSQGRPGLLMKTANMIGEAAKPKSHGYNSTPMSQVPGEQEDDLGNQEATGPEFPPQMPPGTTKVDVSDLTDWYRLGMDISDMDDADPKDYNQGPPQTVIVFPSDEAEQGYLKQFKRLGLKTHDLDPDVKGGEDVVGKHLHKKLAEELKQFKEQDLFEIRMSPSNLRQEAAKTGAMAGMEFEMIVPNVAGADLDPEYERDEGPDRRARSFDDIESFFNDGDYNGRGDIRRLREALDEAYQEWKMDQTADAWDDEGVDFFRDFVANNNLFDRDEALDQARDEVIDANPDLPTDSEEFQKLVSARIDELEEEYVLEEWERQGSNYSDAFEAFAEEKREDYDEAEFLRETTPYMSDVETEYDVQWPYWYDINADQSGEADVNTVADDFSEFMGKPVNASKQYHGARREPGHYVVEPDGSLEGDDPGDAGLEFVSPPMPIDELLADLNKVKKWAGSQGAYTNESTGLHINISVPNFDLQKLDYVKLALLLGDKYVLDQFGRSSNTYTKSAMGKVEDLVRRNPDTAKALLDKMRGHMEDLATKAIHSGTTDKYTSINTKSGYIEFRSPGGDWLDENFDKIENTLLRFTVALSAAMNPEAYREEYLKKLYKLLEPVSDDRKTKDTVKYFADYVAGKLPKAALRSFVKQAQLERSVAKGKTTGPMWWEVTNPANASASIEVVANSAEEAIDSAVLPGNYPEWARVKNTLKATPLRPYEAPKAKSAASPGQGNWGIWINAANRFANQPGEYSRGAEVPLYRFPSREAAEQWIEQQRTARPNMRTDIEVREIPADSAQSQSQQTGRYTYRVYTDSGQTAGTFQSDGIQGSTAANIAFRNYLRSIGRDSASGFNYEEIGRERQSSQFQEPSDNRGDLTPRGPGPWEIYRLSDNTSVRELSNTSRPEAEAEARRALGLRAEAPELYGVRTRRQNTGDPGSLIDQGIAASGNFTGNWLIQDDEGRTIHRFGGIGNSQGDANNFAIRWLQQNPRYLQAGVTVVPEMGR